MKKKKAAELFKIPDPNDARKSIIESFKKKKIDLIEEDGALENLADLAEVLKKKSKKKR